MAKTMTAVCGFSHLSDDIQKQLMAKIVDMVLEQNLTIWLEDDDRARICRLAISLGIPGKAFKIHKVCLPQDKSFTVKDTISNHPDKEGLLKTLGASDVIYK